MILIAKKEWNFYFQGIINNKEKKMHILATYGKSGYEDMISIDEDSRELEDFIIIGRDLKTDRYKMSKNFSTWLHDAIASEDLPEEEISKRYREIFDTLIKEVSLKKLEPIDLIKMTDKVIMYSPAEGMDVVIQGKVFRLHDEDFLNPKNFLIWYASVFGNIAHIDLSKEEWKAVVTAWISMSIKASPGKDTLAPPVLTELIEKIIDNRVENEFTKETLIDLENTQIFAFILKNGDLYVHTKIYNYLMQKYKVSPRRMRQYFEHYLKDDASKQIKVKGSRARFWRMDWNKLMFDFPELEQVKVIEVKEAEIIKDVIDEEFNLSVYKQLLDSLNIEAIKNGIRDLYQRLRKKNVILDRNLEEDIEFLLNSKETDNPDYPREVLANLLKYFQEEKV
ncbi:MAG: hypothetical protein F9Y92_07400 [Thermoplasmatales archaeon]|nr:hypothetical protein [Thermoplasmatales archaeon]